MMLIYFCNSLHHDVCLSVHISGMRHSFRPFFPKVELCFSALLMGYMLHQQGQLNKLLELQREATTQAQDTILSVPCKMAH